MILININKNYRIISDEHQWKVQEITVAGEESENPGELYYRSKTYHPTLGSAVKSLRQRMIRQSDAKGVSEVLKAVENVDTVLSEAVAGV